VEPSRALRLLRFREWAHFLVLPLGGVAPSESLAHNALHLARGVAVAFCVLGFGYLVNAASDVDVDVDPRKNPLLDERARARVPEIAVGLALAAVALAALGPSVGVVAALVAITSGVVYSIGPRLKALPVVGTLANATNFAPLLWVGAATPSPPLAWILAPTFAGILLQNQILHEAADASDDARGRLATTFLVLGRKKSAALASLFGLLAALGPVPFGAWGRAAMIALYVVAFPLALAGSDDPTRAARLRRWHRGSSIVVGAALLLASR
jgi:4-hydroxybenzoate polyprenyltransferase